MNNNNIKLLEANNIDKRFGSFYANKNVGFSIYKGEIHALLGENGAGKSTFVKILYGIQKPDSGSLIWKNKKISIKGPKHARSIGIGMVFQHFSLFESLTVLENIALSINIYKNLYSLEKKINVISKEYGLGVNPSSRIYNLSVGEQQRVEIIRCLLQDPDLLIMDEPTSVLTPQEINQLFLILKKLSNAGCSILFISHKLDEVKSLTSRATVLRRGENVGTVETNKHSSNSLAKLMVGYEVKGLSKREVYKNKYIKFKINNLNRSPETRFSQGLKDINLDIYNGEILGIAGISGNGQNELMETLIGEYKLAKDNVLILDNEDISNYSPDKRRKAGISFIPEERIGHSAIPELSLSENILLTHNNYKNKFFDVINYKKLRDISLNVISNNDVRTASSNPLASSLSGGNLQKFIVGRELLKKPDLLIASQPTWGVDIGAASFIRNAIIDLSRKGAAVIIISQDLDEILSISDKICVIYEGSISKVFDRKQVNLEKIGLLMGGLTISGNSL